MKNQLLLLCLALALSSAANAQTSIVESKSNIVANDVAYGSNSLHYTIAPVPQLGIVSFLIITKNADVLQWTIADAAGKVLNAVPLQATGKLVFTDIPAGTFSEKGGYRWTISNEAGIPVAVVNFTGKNCIPANTNQDK